jgi:5-methylcytosine-specific restriction enzyme subunit McrC
VAERDDLSFVRGRVDIRESLKRSVRGSPYLHCEFQELTHDVEDNGLLLWTLYRVSRAPLRRPEVIRVVRQAYRSLSGAVTLSEKLADDCIGRFYHRLNEDYRPLHGLCRLLLEHLGPDLELGQSLFLPFMLNMPNLFESFVAEWLKKHATENWVVTAQHTAKLKANADLRFRIDLILKDKRSGRPIAIMDTKYKAAALPTEADIQQVVAYAVETEVNRAFLVYPSSRSLLLKLQVGSIEVTSIAFDISAELSEAGGTFMRQLTSLLPADLAA